VNLLSGGIDDSTPKILPAQADVSSSPPPINSGATDESRLAPQRPRPAIAQPARYATVKPRLQARPES
jgi:hypothetical protein